MKRRGYSRRSQKKTKRLDIPEKTFGYLPRIGLEPTCLAAPEPKSGVSAIPPSGQRSNLEKISSFRQLIFK